MIWLSDQKIYNQGNSMVVVIPKVARKNLNWKSGDHVKIGIESGRIILEKKMEGKSIPASGGK